MYAHFLPFEDYFVNGTATDMMLFPALQVGLTQALAGFENDILVMNVECDKEVVPLALEQLQNDLIVCTRHNSIFACFDRLSAQALKQNREISIESIDERKLHYTHGVNQSKVASPSQVRVLVTPS